MVLYQGLYRERGRPAAARGLPMPEFFAALVVAAFVIYVLAWLACRSAKGGAQDMLAAFSKENTVWPVDSAYPTGEVVRYRNYRSQRP